MAFNKPPIIEFNRGLLIIFVILINFLKNDDSKYLSTKMYPIKATEYIKENLDYKNIRIFNEYNFGSYLLFNDIKVFIDSRADLYAPEFNKTEEREGRDIFSDYINISNIGNKASTSWSQ